MAEQATTDAAGPAFAPGPSEHALRMLRNWIEQGRFAGGTRLPSERKLAGRLDVSRTAVRSAMEALEEEGLIESRPDGSRWVREDVCASLLNDTVAILADSPEVPRDSDEKESPGWAHHIHLGALRALRERGLHSLNLETRRVLESGPGYLVAERPRGIIALRDFADCEAARPALQAVSEAGIPVVVYGDVGLVPGVDTVTSDHESGSYRLARWLIERGCRRILRFWGTAAAGGEKPDWLLRRDCGYERAVEEADLEALPAVHIHRPPSETEPNFEHTTRIYAGYLMEHLQGQEPIDAIMAVSDGPVFALAAACRMLGKTPQEDVLLVGYDNYWRDLLPVRPEKTVPLATVDKRNVEIGRALVDLLERRAAGELPPEPQHRDIEPELVVTES